MSRTSFIPKARTARLIVATSASTKAYPSVQRLHVAARAAKAVAAARGEAAAAVAQAVAVRLLPRVEKLPNPAKPKLRPKARAQVGVAEAVAAEAVVDAVEQGPRASTGTRP